MGLFSSSKSRSTVNNTSTVNNIDNSFTKLETNNIDARQDNRQFIDNSFTKLETNNIDARTDARQYTSIDSRQTHNTDNSVTVGAGGINAAGSVTITEIDNGAVEASLQLVDSVFSQSLEAVRGVADEVLDQTAVSFEEANQQNLLIMGGVALAAVVVVAVFAKRGG